MSTLLQLDAVSSGYGRTPVLTNVSMRVEPGEIVALIGANGAGKSTLINTIVGAVALSSGDIHLDGRSIRALKTSQIVRSGVAVVPERRQLFGSMTVQENLQLGAYSRDDRDAVRDTMQVQMREFPILEERRTQPAQTLSGGEQQMLAIARALMSRPRLLLLDEPSLGLAPLMVERIMAQITKLRNAGSTILLVEQNARAALEIADRGYVLENGRISESSSAPALLGNSAVQDAYLGGLGGTSQAVEQRLRARRIRGSNPR